MRSTNRKRTLLFSSAMILLCMIIIMGMTWALFTDTATVKNHLQAGNLDITLQRVALTQKTLDKDGYLTKKLVQKETDAPVDFSKATNENVFGLEANEKIVPGTKFVAKMQIKNEATYSDVAFGYWIEVVFKGNAGGDLAKQLKITVNTGKDKSDFVGEGLKVGGENNYIDVLPIGASDNFTVTVEFLDSAIPENNIADNNLAQGEEIYFDLVVHAVQVTEAPASKK